MYIWSEDVREILHDIPGWLLKWGNTIFVLITLIMFALLWIIKYPDIVSGEVIITTDKSLSKGIARSSGIIENILKKDGDIVQKNDIVTNIESTANFADVLVLKSMIEAIKFDSSKLLFPIDSLPVIFLGEIEPYFSKFQSDYLNYQLKIKYDEYSSNLRIGQKSLTGLRNRLVTLEKQRELNLKELQLDKNRLERYSKLFETGVISEQEYENEETNYVKSQSDYQDLLLSISRIKESIEIGIEKYNKDKVYTEIDKTQEYKKTIQSFNQLKEAMKKWEEKYVLKANNNGVISYSDKWKRGDELKQGETLYSIVPIGEFEYIVKARLSPESFGKITLGQKAIIDLWNYPALEFGYLKGVVSKIGLVPNDQGNHIVEISLKNGLITTYDKSLEFKQEMKGKIEIITKEYTIMSRILHQLRKNLKY